MTLTGACACDRVRYTIGAEPVVKGKGAVSLDGRLIDIASIRQAQALLDKAKQISAA